MKRTTAIYIGTPLAIIFFVIIGLYLLFKPIVESRIRDAGFPEALVGSASVSAAGAKLSQLTLDAQGNTVDQIEVQAGLSDLIMTHAAKIEITGVTLNWPLATAPVAPAAGPLDLRANEIAFKNVTIKLQSPLGPVALLADGTILDKGESYEVSATLTAAPAFGRIDGKVTASIDKISRAIKARYDISAAQFNSPDVEMKAVTGWITAETDPARAMPLLNAHLSIGGLLAYGLPMQAPTLTLSSTTDKMEAVLTGQVIDDSGDVNLDVRLDQSDKAVDTLVVNAEAKLKHLDALEAVDMGGQGSMLLAVNATHMKSGSWADITQWKQLTGSLGLDMQQLSLPGLIGGGEALATLRLVLDPATRQLTATAADGPVTFNGKLKALGNRNIFINIAANAKTPAALRWDVPKGALKADIDGADIAALDFMAKGIAAHISTVLNAAPTFSGTVAVDQLRHNTQTPYFMPVKLALNFAAQNGSAPVTAFTGAIAEKTGRFSAKLQGQYDAAAEKGAISFNMPPTNFVQNVATVGAAFPYTQGYIQDAFGTLGLSANASFAKNKNGWTTTTQGQLFLKDFTCTVRDNVISNISTVMNLDSLSPPIVTKQTVAIGALNVGLPLTEGVANVSLDAAKNFTLNSAVWNAAGGKISSSSFTMPLSTMNAAMTLTAKGLDLQQLFQIAPMDGLSAEGHVDGSIPLEVKDGGFIITNGVLQTTGPGTIHYNPQTVPAFLQNNTSPQIADLRAALTAFNFDSLKMTLNGALGASQKISLQISGRNPLFYSGHPVNFNLNVEGPIGNILKYAPGNSRIPDGITQQMKEYEAKHGG